MLYKDLKWFSIDNFVDQIKAWTSQGFKCYRKELQQFQQELDDAKVIYRAQLGNRPEQIVALHVNAKTNSEVKKSKNQKYKKVKIFLKVVPDDAECLMEACAEFEKVVKLKMPYHGESHSVVTDRMIKTLFCSRRLVISPLERTEIEIRQRGKCDICDLQFTVVVKN